MNGFLLDTNIASELIRTRPDPRVDAWVKRQPVVSLFTSVLSIGELRRGFELLPKSERRTRLEQWFARELLPSFGDRVLPVTASIAVRWGVLDANRQLKGMPLNTADGLIAATALEHDLTLVTRNVKDFAGLGVSLLNPWEAG